MLQKQPKIYKTYVILVYFDMLTYYGHITEPKF